MSGGVDSSVVALLLKEQGHNVIGLFMKNWEEKDEHGHCTTAQDYDDVKRVCDRIGIAYHAVEFVREYWDRVFVRFLKEYEAGYTPNPDVLCNREIKFDVFLEKASDLGATSLATGHYTQIGRDLEGRATLLKGADANKDQSYFLHAVRTDKLERARFPIGHLNKTEIREIAKHHGLATATKKDSTGICFIGERDFRDFLSKYLPARPGEIRHLDQSVVGEHEGSAYYTLGQRKGLGLGGEGEAWYVVAKDSKQNIVYVERGADHPALFADWLEAEETSWVTGLPNALARGDELKVRAKVRYRQPDQDCRVRLNSDGRLHVSFAVAQRAITPGQSVVFYDDELCLGGAVIRHVGPSRFSRGLAISQLLPSAQA